MILPPGCVLPGLDDSKRVEPEIRKRLDREIRARALAVGVGVVSAATIDVDTGEGQRVSGRSVPERTVVVDPLLVRYDSVGAEEFVLVSLAEVPSET